MITTNMFKNWKFPKIEYRVLRLLVIAVVIIIIALLCFLSLQKRVEVKFNNESGIALSKEIGAYNGLIPMYDSMYLRLLNTDKLILADSIRKLKYELEILKSDAQKLILKLADSKTDAERKAIEKEIQAFLLRSSLALTEQRKELIKNNLVAKNFEIPGKETTVFVKDEKSRRRADQLKQELDSLSLAMEYRNRESDSIQRLLDSLKVAIRSAPQNNPKQKPTLYVLDSQFEPILGNKKKDAYRRKDIRQKGFSLTFILGSQGGHDKDFENEKVSVLITYPLQEYKTTTMNKHRESYTIKLNHPYTVNIAKGSFGSGPYNFRIFLGDDEKTPIRIGQFDVR